MDPRRRSRPKPSSGVGATHPETDQGPAVRTIPAAKNTTVIVVKKQNPSEPPARRPSAVSQLMSISSPMVSKFKSMDLGDMHLAGYGQKGKGKKEEGGAVGKTEMRRKSCTGSPETDFVALGAKILAQDMPPFMQNHAVTCARAAYDANANKFSAKNLAFALKKEFDKVYGPAWHCIVGTSFGSFVTHSVGGFVYFSIDKLSILLFKTSVQRAE